MDEPKIMFLIVAGVACWMLGGYRWKWLRRYVWPLCAGVFVLVAGVEWWRALLVGVSFGVVNALPYGDRTPFLSYGLPVWWIEIYWWSTVVFGATLPVLMFASQKFDRVSWKLWEASAGLLQAAVVVMAIL